MPVNKTGPVKKLEGNALKALRDTVTTQAEEIRKLKKRGGSPDTQSLTDRIVEQDEEISTLRQMVEHKLEEITNLQALNEKGIEQEHEIEHLRKMVEDQLHEIEGLKPVPGNPPPSEVVKEMNEEMEANPIGTSAVEMGPPTHQVLPPLEDYPPPYDA